MSVGTCSDKLQIRLHPDDLAVLQGNGTVLNLSKGEELLPTRNDKQTLYIVLSGYVKVSIYNAEGKKFTLCMLSPGETWTPLEGLSANWEQSMYQLSLCMLGNGQLLRINQATYLEVLATRPKLSLQMLQLVQSRVSDVAKRLIELQFKDVYSRLARLILETTFEHGQDCPHAVGMAYDINLKHHEIAELIGASRPVTSVALSKFAKGHLVHRHDGFLCVIQIEALKRIADTGYPALIPFLQTTPDTMAPDAS